MKIWLIEEIERIKKENPDMKVKDLEKSKVSYEHLEQNYFTFLEKVEEILDFQINWKKVREYLVEAKVI